MTAGVLDIPVNRGTPFSDDIPCEGYDFTGGTFLLQVREYKGAPGAPLLELTNTTAPAQGISVSVEVVDGLPISTLFIRINETTIEALRPFAVDGSGRPNRTPASDVVLAYDMHVTATGYPKDRLLEGQFIILEGVIP